METKCKCNNYENWFIQRFGQNSFIVLCRHCGKNATEAAEKCLGISLKYDDYEMAVNHLELARYEKAKKITQPEPKCKTCGDKKCSYAIWVTYQDNVGSGLYEEYHERAAWACSFFPPRFREVSMSACLDSGRKYHHKIGWYRSGKCECESCENSKPCPDCPPEPAPKGEKQPINHQPAQL